MALSTRALGVIGPIVVAAAGTFASGSASADEAYICDNGRIVYVKPGDLEHLKRTDPCIAGYYGLTVAPAGAQAGDNASAGKAATQTPPIPPGGAEAGLKLEREARAAIAAKKGMTTGSLKSGAAAKPTPVAAPNTDFRNVIILNAQPDAPKVFRHER